jgi:hypothetical protein
MLRDPRSMSHDEIVAEIQTLRGELERNCTRLVELSMGLYNKARRGPSDDYTSRYLSFASNWTRFAQMVEGALQRTGSSFRLIESVRREQQQVEEAPRPQRSARKKASTSQPSSDLVELYGPEMVTYAAR